MFQCASSHELSLLVFEVLMFFYILVLVEDACSYLKEINKCNHGTCETTAGNNYPKCRYVHNKILNIKKI